MYPEDLKFIYGQNTRQFIGSSLRNNGNMGGLLSIDNNGALNLRIDGEMIGSALSPQEMLNVANPVISGGMLR